MASRGCPRRASSSWPSSGRSPSPRASSSPTAATGGAPSATTPPPRPAGLSGAEWQAVLDELRALGTLYVALTGVSPSPTRVPRHRPRRPEARLRLRILTNGALVTDALATEIAALRPLAVELSLHGATAETHDRATATPGSFDALLRGVDRLLARNVSVVLKTPLTRLNERETAGLRRIAEERGVPWRVDAVLTPRDDGDAGPLDYRASAEAVERMFRELAVLGRLPREERAAGGTNCGLGRTTIAVDPEGNVFPCVQWRRAPSGTCGRRGSPRSGPARPRGSSPPPWPGRERPPRRGGRRGCGVPLLPALALQRTGDPLRPTRATGSRPRPPSGSGSIRGEVPRGRRPLLRRARGGTSPRRARGDVTTGPGPGRRCPCLDARRDRRRSPVDERRPGALPAVGAGGAAVVDGRLLCSHRSFTADIDPFSGRRASTAGRSAPTRSKP